MKIPFSKRYLSAGVTAFCVIACSILFYLLLDNFSAVSALFHSLVGIVMPIIVGFVIAYLLNPVLNFFERTCFDRLLGNFHFKKMPKKLSRALSITATLISFMLLIAGLISMVVPQLAASIYGIAQKTPDYINNLKLWADGLVSSNPDIADLINGQIDNISKYSQELLTKYSPMLDGFVKGITKGVFSVLIGTKNFMIGIIISIYIMASKEKFLAQSKKIIFAFFSRSFSTRLIGKIRKTNTIFSGFVTGQIIDAFIVATLCFICLSIFKIPYALLVSVLIGVTNIIPFFGPFIGAIPSAIIIFMENPMKSLFFVIIILIIQQVDGNVINPRILGESTGLSAFWVIFAILIAGGLFGFVGMFVGVPTFAVIYTLIRSAVEERLEKKGLPTDTNDYKKPNPIPKIE